jgi:hypothetical protein
MKRPTPAKNTSEQPTKAELVTNLHSSPKGVSLGEIAQTTRWQPHSCHAFLTGLRKKAHNIIRTKRKDDTTYCRIDKKSAPASADAAKTRDGDGAVFRHQEAA